MFSRATWISAAALVALSACSGGANQTTPADGSYIPQDTAAAPQSVAAAAPQDGASATQVATPSLAAAPSGAGYTVRVFARGTSTLTNPDPIVSQDGWTYVAYQNKTTATGGGGESTIVKYGARGVIHHTRNLPGRIDGMRFNPYDHHMWVTVNEDGNSSLFTIDLISWTVHHYAFSAATHGGGYDDLVFANGKAFIAASNPTLNSSGINNHPALISVVLKGGVAEVTPVLMGNAAARDIPTGKTVKLNLTDPDSTTVAPDGDVVLISQADSEIVKIHNAGIAGQSVSRLIAGTQLDDTQYATEPDGLFYVVDSKADTTYVVRGNFSQHSIYSEAPSDSTTYPGSILSIDPMTGSTHPIIKGFTSPTALLFVTDRDAAALKP